MVATIANASYTLSDAGWSGSPLSGAAWAVIPLVVASARTGVILYIRRDVAYALVIVWALAGIAALLFGRPGNWLNASQRASLAPHVSTGLLLGGTALL